MPSVRAQREADVARLTEELDGLRGLVVAGYAGVKTPELNDLRGKLRPLQGRCRVIKNTLAKIAFKNRGINGLEAFLDGPSAVVITKGDAMAGFKAVVDFVKAHRNIKIRGGFVDGRVVQSAEIKTMASLPTKPVLLALALQRLQGHLYGLRHVMEAPVRYLINALDQAAQKKAA
jgi:large subunit ribosomal protein L10